MGGAMRGDDEICGSLLSYVDLEKRVRAAHPLRVIREVANAALKALGGEFAALYSAIGRGSIPPERLLRGLLLQAFYSIRSERQLVERIEYDCCSLGLSGSVSRTRCGTRRASPRTASGCLKARWPRGVSPRCVAQPKVKRLLSNEHFSVDGTLLEAWASVNSFRPKDGSGGPPGPGRNSERDFHGERRRNDTHASTTDADARLFRKGPGKEARLWFTADALIENRKERAGGRRGGEAGLGPRRTVGRIGADRTLYRAVAAGDAGRRQRLRQRRLCHGVARAQAVTPHVAQNQSGRRPAIDDRTTRHPGYAISLRIRKRFEEAFVGRDGGRVAQDAASRAAQG